MDVVGRFHAALDLELTWFGPDLLPTALAHTAAQVLPVAAVGIGLVDRDHRTPLGASADEAVVAERWQFTVGDDPCSAAVARGSPVVADEESLRRRWPELHALLRRHTPYRSMVALPLGRGGSALGTVALYLHQASPDPAPDVDAARVVTALVHRELLRATDGAVGGPVWMDGPAARGREAVWVAVGRCIGALGLDADGALALLRRHALTRDVTVDALAGDVVSGRVPVRALSG